MWGYTWKVGDEVCGDSVFGFNDPFAHLLDPAMWTYQGLYQNVVLPDGHYYLTTQGINKIIFGGALVTTLCHPESIGKSQRQ
jgi:hypothetical protein